MGTNFWDLPLRSVQLLRAGVIVVYYNYCKTKGNIEEVAKKVKKENKN